MSRARLLRLFGLSGLIFYSGSLLASSLPAALLPFGPIVTLKRAAQVLLHSVGVTPGLEVFSGQSGARAILHMMCFRISAVGAGTHVLFDDFERCHTRRVQALRDPFQVFQVASLAGPLVDLDLGYRQSLASEPMQSLFLLSDYYCHVPEAERAQARWVSIEARYIGLNLDDGSTGQVDMGGRRDCRRPGWELRRK